MEQINKKHFYSKQNGRALLMLATDKEIYKTNRKREYSVKESIIEELKEYKSKRLKPLNDDFVNENIIILREKKLSKWVWTYIREYWENIKQ